MIKAAIILAGMAFFLASGCVALPPAIAYLSYAKTGFDLVSMIQTEKTLTDHAISYVMDQDCNTLRILSLDDICAPLVMANADVADFQGEDGLRVSLPAAFFGDDGRLLLQRTLGPRLQSKPVTVAALSEADLASVSTPIQRRPASEIRLRRDKSRNEIAPGLVNSYSDGLVSILN